MNKILKTFFPLFIFFILSFFLWEGLKSNPSKIPSPLIGKPMPAFKAESLFDSQKIISNTDLKGKIILFNVFATWCISCESENSVLVDLSNQKKIKMIGLNYKDNRKQAIKWLDQLGNPYDQVIFDPEGTIGINFGVYGTPETFIIDQLGVIRFKFVGPH